MMEIAARWCFELRDPLVYGAVEVFGEMDDRLSVAESGEGDNPSIALCNAVSHRC